MDSSDSSDYSDGYDPADERPRRERFTEDEDRKLKRAVEDNGTHDWEAIARLIPHRSGRQCRDRYVNYLKPVSNNAPWTPEDDKLIQEEYAKYGSSWSLIAKHIKGRTPTQIKNRWRVLSRAAARVYKQKSFQRARNMSLFTGRLVNKDVDDDIKKPEKGELDISLPEEIPIDDFFPIVSSKYDDAFSAIIRPDSIFNGSQFMFD